MTEGKVQVELIVDSNSFLQIKVTIYYEHTVKIL